MFNEETQLNAPIRWGMVGGGRGSEIGYSHRAAAQRDRLFIFVAGALDIDPERGRDFGTKLGLDAERCYPDYKTLFAEEAKREDGIQLCLSRHQTPPTTKSLKLRWKRAYTWYVRSPLPFMSKTL